MHFMTADYGKNWYFYLCNRSAENLENIFQAIADIIAGKNKFE